MLRTTWNHIRRSPYQSIIAIVSVTIMLYVASIFLILAVESHVFLNYIETRPQIIVFFKDGLKTSDLENVKKTLNDTGLVTSLKYVSKDEALKYYKDQNKKDPLLLEMVTADILPASLEVSAKEAGDLKTLYEMIKKFPNIEEINFQKDTVDQLVTLTGGIRKIGIEFLLILYFAASLIILTLVSLKITLKKEEIEILHLLGATNWYIRWPFLLEGVFYGLSGAFFGWIIILLRGWQILPILNSLPAGIPLIELNPQTALLLLGIMSTIGTFVGAIGSFFAVKRYLK